jgi:hypothetical protein
MMVDGYTSLSVPTARRSLIVDLSDTPVVPVVTEHAAVFDGLDDYVEIADHPDYSIKATYQVGPSAASTPVSCEPASGGPTSGAQVSSATADDSFVMRADRVPGRLHCAARG